MLRLLLVLLTIVSCASAESEHTKEGGPCASLKELEDDYVTRKEPQVFNIVDPSTQVQCTWAPSENRICQGVGGRCEAHDEL